MHVALAEPQQTAVIQLVRIVNIFSRLAAAKEIAMNWIGNVYSAISRCRWFSPVSLDSIYAIGTK